MIVCSLTISVVPDLSNRQVANSVVPNQTPPSLGLRLVWGYAMNIDSSLQNETFL